ncbi:MAG: hypothetical protein V2B13_16885 [Pseudomonadota bacterium]
MTYRLLTGVLILMVVIGCAGDPKQFQMRDMTGKSPDSEKATKTVELPKGTLFGGASTEQAGTLAQLFVDSHNMAMQQFGRIIQTQETLKETQKSIQEGQEFLKKSTKGLEESNQKILDQGQKNLETAQKTLQLLEQLSQKQGTGELTLFFNTGETTFHKKSLEYERLVRFVDFLARESKGRKVLFVSIGSSSAVGKKSWNLKLARIRAEYPQGIIEKYLVNIPHEFFKVYGTGDLYSPKGIPKKERERYQHTRLIALFDSSQVPALPEESLKK